MIRGAIAADGNGHFRFSSGLRVTCEVALSRPDRNGLLATSNEFAVSVLHGKVSGVCGRFRFITRRETSIVLINTVSVI